MLDPLIDTMTVVIHLPQPVDKVSALLMAISEQWPDAKFVDGLSRLEVDVDPADLARREATP